MRLKAYAIPVVCMLSLNWCYAQDSLSGIKDWRPVIKVGVSQNVSIGGDIFLGNTDYRTPEHNGDIDYANQKPGVVSYKPYVSAGITKRFPCNFEIYTGLSYMQNRQSFSYFSYKYEYPPGHNNAMLNKEEISGVASLTQNILRFEITPSVYYRNTRLMLGLFNLDYIRPVLNSSDIIKNTYNVYTYNEMATRDSSKILLSSESYVPGKNFVKSYFTMPVSIAVEHEFLFRRQHLLVGAKALYSKLASYYSFMFYAGYVFVGRD